MTPLKTLIVDLLHDQRLKGSGALSESRILENWVPEQIRYQKTTVSELRVALRQLERAGLTKRTASGYILTR